MKETLALAAEAIRSANRIVLASHVNPDGDTLGSSLAITHALKHMGKYAVPLSHDGVPPILKWMPGAEWIEIPPSPDKFDLAILCDTSSADRAGDAEATLEAACRHMKIDHHVAEGDFGHIKVVDPKVSSTGELAFALIKELGVPITKEIADCLLCAIITDTGSFRFMNVRPQTLRIAAELMEAGGCPAEISELVFDTRSYASVKLLGRALDSMQATENGKVAWAHIRASDFEDLSATDTETEGIVNHVRAVSTAQVGVLFREIPGKKVRVSMRSRPGLDVNAVANLFGGGGHHLAAGCTFEPPLEAAEEALIAELSRRVA